ncbi:MAG: response regulator [Acidobacteria bacterium]|nr:response regulator [Acidobacteriota bacterium]
MAYLMIVDDDEDFAAAAAKALSQAGHEVGIELEATSAIGRMAERRPDLLILDVMFPEDASAGFELARTIRHDHADLKDMPILMLTAVNVKFPLGFGQATIDEDWMPVDDFIEKPVDLDVLTSRVSALLAKSRE